MKIFLGSSVLTLIVTLTFVTSFAQTKGSVTVIKDAKIDSLIAKSIELNQEAANGTLISTDGFRVQIFSGADRNEAYAEQARFKGMYPLIRTYISYVQPNYKIRVGDFRTRIEAEKLVNQLRQQQYKSLFIFSEQINLPR